ncbi:MAG: hypothetical protein QG650_72 [Patescibacteria group bacterium]|nr:hypothetical protein [Patescibacteria group bacterium]
MSLAFFKKPALSAIAFFGTLAVLSVGYATYSSLSSVNTGDTLTKDLWNQMVANFADHETRLNDSTFKNLGRGTAFDFNDLTSKTAGIRWADGGGTNLNGPINGGNTTGFLLQFDPLHASNPNAYRVQISSPTTGQLYWREQVAGGWRGWSKFVTEDSSGNANISGNLGLNVQIVNCTNGQACDIDGTAQAVTANCPAGYAVTGCSPICYDTTGVRYCGAQPSGTSCTVLCQNGSGNPCNGTIQNSIICMRITDIGNN